MKGIILSEKAGLNYLILIKTKGKTDSKGSVMYRIIQWLVCEVWKNGILRCII